MSLYILVIDYILGVIMWTLIGRSAMNIFQKEDSEFFFMKVFVKYTNPIIKLGVINLNNLIIGFVYFTKTLIKKNSEASFCNIFIADLPIKVHITTPRI